MKRALVVLVSIVFVVNIFTFGAGALQAETLFEKGLKSAADKMGYETGDKAPTIESKIGIIIQSALSFLGVVFFLLMIYGGFLWMTAKGNEQQVDKAKDLITAAIIGLVIVIAAYAISYFVIKALSGSETLWISQ